MLGISQAQTIDESDSGSLDITITMNKLSEGNQPLLSDAGAFVVGHNNNGRIGRLKDGDCSENICEEDDAKSLTLDSLKDKSKLAIESQRDRDFVSESSLTIVSDSNLFQENSRWWSMINNSESNLNINSTNAISPNSNNDINTNNNTSYISNITTNNDNNINAPSTNASNTTTNNNINNANSNSNSSTFINNHGSNNNGSNNHDSMNNYYRSNRSNSYQTRRRSSLLSEITFDSEDDDEQTTESGDSSWANNSALLTTARRFAPCYCPTSSNRVDNEIIEEEHHDYHEKLKHGRDTSTAAPVIPRRRISKNYKGHSRSSGNSGTSSKAAAAGADCNPAYALRAMARGNATAPTIPKRTSSHNSKKPSIKNNTILYQIYNASMTSINSSQITQDTDPSFFEDGSAAAAAAAAYLSSAATQQEEVRTVQTAITSHTTETPVLKNQADGRRLSREGPLIEPETPPMLPERRESVNDLPPTSFGTFSSFEEDSDEHPSVVHEEEPHENDSAANNPKKSFHHLPSVPTRKRSGSDKGSSYSSRSSGSRKPASRINTQPPTCPMRKGSNHHAQKSPIPMQSPVIQSNRNAALNRLRLSPHKSQSHKPPTKPTRTNSSSNNRSSAKVKG